ncbi:MAG: TonB-dependent receptor [Thermoanaerobaculia bacterium]
MHHKRFRFARREAFVPLLVFSFALAPAGAQDSTPVVTESIQVVATRTAEPVEPVPVAVTVVTGEELRARGADDLASALALVGGVSIAPGGDGGPASSVPEIWGLREFDAFLLVVDGVPWGGAFNPALATLDLNNIERVEVLRGAAPVMYGATSFVGVIEVVHYAAGDGARSATVYGGSHSSGGASVYLPFAGDGAYRQSLAVNYDRKGLEDDRAGYDKAHLLYRGLLAAAGGTFRFDFDGTMVNQEPTSPHPREGRTLTPRVPVDANHNPRDAKMDENRFHLVAGYDRMFDDNDWSTTIAFTRTERELTKGFLHEVDGVADPNAAGFSQDQESTDIYFDSHLVMPLSPVVQVIVGVDYLFGKGESEGENFDYHVNLDGSGAQGSGDVPVHERTELEDERNFAGLYAQLEWTPADRWRFDLGVRLNRTEEEREGEAEPVEEEGDEEEEGGKDSGEVTRGSGVVGVSYRAWGEADGDALWLFADYRDSFKPAAIDFGPEAESVEILKPETATSYEVGVKGRNLGRRLNWQATWFQMDFENLVTGAQVDGRPVLINSGTERFEGYEVEGELRIFADLVARASFAHHEAKFKDFVQLFDGEPTQLAGHRLEMSPEELASAGVSFAPARGLGGWLTWNYVGDRYLNKRNTALAPSFSTWAAGASWTSGAWRVALLGENLSDQRDPVSESELGDAQYYRLPARSYELRLSFVF